MGVKLSTDPPLLNFAAASFNIDHSEHLTSIKKNGRLIKNKKKNKKKVNNKKKAVKKTNKKQRNDPPPKKKTEEDK